jgi:hypothetical protein
LLGFTRIDQIHENLKAVEVMRKWNNELEEKCAAIINNQPAEEFDFPKGAMIPNRRKTNLYRSN